jgi:alkyl sulfatase BDS1-like metallo-beta-lactamase superfamily hydrolase
MKAPFEPGNTTTGPKGQLAHPDALSHSERLVKKLYSIGERAWCLVGNGLSNQTFIEGPEGLIVIDTGECIEEMSAALAELRKVTDTPVAACIYSHFHYVNGTKALESEISDFPVWGHEGIEANLKRFGGEVSPRVSRGLVQQFAVMMPEEGPDGVVNVGLGNFYRNPDHAPFTPGYIPAGHTFTEPTIANIAGLEVHLLPAPSDATDSATIWFPDLGIAVNNLVWPALFNIFAIRGEEYRDPRILLKGLDELHDLNAEYLIGAHGPPLLGRENIAECVSNYRDAIQFLWDQTVRGANLGLTLDELTEFVRLPDGFASHYTTRQFYGIAEHHVRQIYTGLFGWFDEDEARLLPVPAPDRAVRLIEGFGGINKVRAQVDTALADQEYRWALELSSWLVRRDTNGAGRADAGDQEDRNRLAEALRGIGQTTTSANLRNWCLTRALELNGDISLERFRTHRFRTVDVSSRPAAESLSTLRVLLVPERASGMNQSLMARFDDGSEAALHIRNCVAVPMTDPAPGLKMNANADAWAKVLGGKMTLQNALADGLISTDTPAEVLAFFACFDLATLKS